MVASQTFGITSTSMPAGAIVVPVGVDIQSVVDSAPAGSTFWIEAGEHRMQSVTPKDNDHFIGQEGAILNGSHQITDFTKEGANWVASDQTQEGMRLSTDKGIPGAERAGYPETFFIDDKPLSPVDSLGKVAPGKFYFDYAADKIYFQDDPAGHKVEAGVSPFAFAGGAKGVTVENLVIEKYDPPVQHAAVGWDPSAQGWVVQNNEIRLNYALGAYVGTDGKIVGNNIHDNGQMGLGANGTDILVQGNEIGHNGYFAGIDPGFEGGGSKFAQTTNLQVLGNYAHDNNGYGLWTDIDNIHTLYDGNTVVNNLAGGISHEISYDATIRNNVVTGNGSPTAPWLWDGQIQIQNSKNVEVYGNHVDATTGGNGITLIQQDRGSGAYGPHTTTGNAVHDNVIVDGTPGAGVSGSVADFDEAGLRNGGNSFANNAYHYADPSGQHFSWVNTGYDFSGFQTTAGEDAGATISTQIPVAQTVPVGFTPAPETPAPSEPGSQTPPVAADPALPATTAPAAPEHAGSADPASTPVVSTPVATEPASPATAQPAAPEQTGSTAPAPVTAQPGAGTGDGTPPVPAAPDETSATGSAPHTDQHDPGRGLAHCHGGTEAQGGGATPTSPVSASSDAHPSWADLLADHGVDPSVASAISARLDGHVDWQAVAGNALQHYAGLAEQHWANHAGAETATPIDHFHHASAGGHWG